MLVINMYIKKKTEQNEKSKKKKKHKTPHHKIPLFIGKINKNSKFHGKKKRIIPWKEEGKWN